MNILKKISKRVIRKLIPTLPEILPSGIDFRISFCDVGSADGLPAQARWLSRILNVVGYEPDPRSLEQTRQKLSEMNIASCNLIDRAVDEVAGSHTLYLTHKPQCSSFYKPNMSILSHFPSAERFSIEKTIELSCVPLSDLAADIDWLKVDTQGSELRILKSLGERISRVILADIEIEILEMYQDQPLLAHMLDFLSSTHQLIRFDVVNWRGISSHEQTEILMHSKGRSVFANTLWLKKDLLPETFNCSDKAEIQKTILLLLSYQQFALAEQIFSAASKKGVPLSSQERDHLFNVYNRKSWKFRLGQAVSRISGVRSQFNRNKFNFDEE